MAEPAKYDPLHDQLVARVDDWVENALNPQDCAAALREVLLMLRDHEHAAIRWADPLPVPEWVGQMRRTIAAALGVDAPQPR